MLIYDRVGRVASSYQGLNEADTSLMFIIAALNEEAGIGLTISEIRDVLGDPFLLVVDGNSSDSTAYVARTHDAEVVMQNGKKGKGSAIAQGLEYAREQGVNTDYVVFIDADYTYPAEHIPRMVEILETNKAVGMVIGDRSDSCSYLSGTLGDAYYFGNRVLALMHYLLNGVRLRDPLSGLRVVRWDLLKDWRPESESFDIEVELNYFVERMGYGTVEIPIRYRPRLGQKKLKVRHGLTILKRMISQAASRHNSAVLSFVYEGHCTVKL